MSVKSVSYAAAVGLVAIALAAIAAASATQFRFTGPAKYGVYLASTETGTIKHLAGFCDWSLSPDGKWVAGSYQYQHAGAERNDVSVVSVATGKKTLLKAYVCHPEYPWDTAFAWSPDSRWLRVEGGDATSRVDIVAVQPKAGNGAKPTNVAWKEAPVIRPSGLRVKGYTVDEAVLSPDRRRIAADCSRGLYGNPGYDAGIFLCDADGSHRTRVTTCVYRGGKDGQPQYDADDREIKWLANGKGIVFRRTSHEDEGW